MSEAYDSSMRSVRDWKECVLKSISHMLKDGANCDEIAVRIDGLNKAWDELAEVLMRQIEERDGVIIYLMDELAKRKPR